MEKKNLGEKECKLIHKSNPLLPHDSIRPVEAKKT